MSERSKDIRFFLDSEFSRMEEISGVKNSQDIAGDQYTLTDYGHYTVEKPGTVTLFKQGYTYLDTVRQTLGPSTKVRFITQIKEDDTLEANWVTVSDPFVDMYSLSFDDESENPSVICKLIQGGDLKTLDAAFGDEYDLVGVDAPELPFVQVRHDPVQIFRRSKINLQSFSIRRSFNDTEARTIPSLLKFKSDDNVSATQSVEVNVTNPSAENSAGGFFYFTSDRDKTLTIKGSDTLTLQEDLNFVETYGIFMFLSIFGGGEDLNPVDNKLIFSTGTIAPSNGVREYPIDFDFTVDLLEGQSLALTILPSYTLNADDVMDIGFSGEDIDILEDSTYPTTYSKALLPRDAFQHLAGRILGDPDYPFVSSVFGEGQRHETKLLIHGTWLRNMPPILNEGEDDERRLQASLSMENLYGGYKILEPLRYDITVHKGKNTFTVGAFKDIQQNVKTIQVGRTTDKFRLTPVSDKQRDVVGDDYYRKIILGSNSSGENYGEVNNLYSIGGKAEWNSPHTDSEGTYEVTTDFRTGAEDIELQRQLQYEDNGDSDEERDDDWFLLDAEWNGVEYVAKKWQRFYTEAPTGVYSAETTYNWAFAPMELLRGHGYSINRGMQQLSSQFLTDPVGNCNLSVATKRENEEELVANEPFPLSLLEKPRQLPIIYSFNVPFSAEILEQLRSATNGVDNKAGLAEVQYGEEVIQVRLFSAKVDDIIEFKVIQAVT